MKKLERYNESEDRFNLCLREFKQHYGALKELIDISLKKGREINEFKNLIDRFFNLDPTNPRVCQDLLDLFDENERVNEIKLIFEQKFKEFESNMEVQGNVYYHLGLLYIELCENDKAIDCFLIARERFNRTPESNHYVLDLIKQNLKNLKN